MEGLKDIKGIVEVHDSSLYIFASSIGGALLLLLLLLYIFYRYRKREKRETIRDIAKNQLQNLDFSDAKNCAYLFTESSYVLVDEEHPKRGELEEILKSLETYKFKKAVPSIEAELQNRMLQFIKEVVNG